MKRHSILLTLAIGFMALSCTKSELQPAPTPVPGNETPVQFSLSSGDFEEPVMALAGKSTAAGSRAMSVSLGSAASRATPPLATGEEQKIHDLWVIQYDKTGGNLVGQPCYVESEGISQSGSKISFEARLTSKSIPQTVVFVANTHSPSTFHVDNCAKLSDLEKVSRLLTAEYQPTAATGLPMIATQDYNSISAGTPLAGPSLRYLAARVSLRWKVASELAAQGFTVTAVQLHNAASTITYAPAGSTPADYPARSDHSHFDYPLEDPKKAAVDGNYQTFTWYTPENRRKALANVTDERNRTLDKTDGMATWIEVRGAVRSASASQQVSYAILLGNITGSLNDYNVLGGRSYTVTVSLDGLNPADKRVSIETFDMNNSAMIRPNSGDLGAVTFDIRKALANGFTTANDLKSSTLTADVLWQDGNVINTADVKLDKVNGLLTVRSSKEAVGNAVVALYPDASKAQGTILWSWHVWVTAYRPGAGVKYAMDNNSKWDVPGGQVHTYGEEYAKKNAGKAIMDRNLGATKAYYAPPKAGDATADQAFGFFYQWGRKDPFPRWDGKDPVAPATQKIYAANGTTALPENGTGYRKVNVITAIEGGANSLPYAIKNPLAFITNGADPFDWYTNIKDNASQNNGLWGNGGAKSAYDPCPKGWRVPPGGTWNDFTRNATEPQKGTAPCYVNGLMREDGTDENDRYTTNGRLYNGFVWYGFTGYRSAPSGALSQTGLGSLSFSSQPTGTSSVTFDCSLANINYAGGGDRATNRQVRCIQE